MIKAKSVCFLIVIALLVIPFITSAGTVQLPQTGQTKCYDTAGNEIACAGTGQDGEIQAGVPWPNPRFHDNGDGTVTDNLTGLMWLKSPDSTARNWDDAVDYCNNLNFAGHSDWRLPNVNELESLINADEPDQAIWLTKQGFSNLQSYAYWSSSTQASNTNYVWRGGYKGGSTYVWPVRSGQSGSFGNSVISLPQTGQKTSYRAGDDGDLKKGVAWPSPRFTDNSDGTVTDNLTGLMWTKNANLAGLKTWQLALGYINDLNNASGSFGNGYYNYGYTDWRLPNRKELRSLIDYSQYNPALSAGHPFTNVQSDIYSGKYWSSSTVANSTSRARFVNMKDGVEDYNVKSYYHYVWPVRSGQSGSFGNLAYFSFTTIPSAQSVNTPFPVTIIARDANGLVKTDWNGEVQIWSSAGAVSPDKVNLVNGYWSDNVTLYDAGNGIVLGASGDGKSGESNAFDVIVTGGGLGNLCGTVRDENGNLIDGATVSLSTVENGTPISSTITVNGQYAFNDVGCGTYYVSGSYNGQNSSGSGKIYVPCGQCATQALVIPSSPVIMVAGIVQLPQTGQTKCYDTTFYEIACAGTGQDGDSQAGIPWPSPRFHDNGDGTVTDNLTGLMWVKSPDSSTIRNWNDAVDYCNNLNFAGYSDWRLPNVNEFESLTNADEPNNVAWLNTQGFSIVQPSYPYWSSSTYAYETVRAWYVGMVYGFVGSYSKGDNVYVWPVRSGQCGSFGNSVISLPQTGQKTSYRAGDDGDLKTGVASPNPRFTDNSDGTVTDNLTGLMWTKNAHLPNSANPWQEALDYCNNLNFAGYTDWRLPNRNELRSLIDYSQYYPALPVGHPFTNVKSGYYWSSSSYADELDFAWYVNMYYGLTHEYPKVFGKYVWPVRSVQSGPFGDLIISKSGIGSGTVTSTPAGIDCGTICSASFPMSQTVTLSANPSTGSLFTGWGGACTGTGDCIVTMDATKFVTAEFNPSPTAITLSAFKARQRGKKVLIKWKTSSEIDNLGFNILRSDSENGTYEKIKFIKAKKNAVSGAKYKFKDRDITKGNTYWYKLEDIDSNTGSSVHDAVEVKVKGKAFKKKRKK